MSRQVLVVRECSVDWWRKRFLSLARRRFSNRRTKCSPLWRLRPPLVTLKHGDEAPGPLIQGWQGIAETRHNTTPLL